MNAKHHDLIWVLKAILVRCLTAHHVAPRTRALKWSQPISRKRSLSNGIAIT